jgi:hypothetical protein
MRVILSGVGKGVYQRPLWVDAVEKGLVVIGEL